MCKPGLLRLCRRFVLISPLLLLFLSWRALHGSGAAAAVLACWLATAGLPAASYWEAWVNWGVWATWRRWGSLKGFWL